STAVYVARQNRALGHVDGYETVPLEIPLIPSGGVYASVRDMTRYALFHLNAGKVGGKQLLESRFWEEMHSFPFAGRAYGLAVERERTRFGDTTIDKLTHDGGGVGFSRVFSFYPQTGPGWAAVFHQYLKVGCERV